MQNNLKIYTDFDGTVSTRDVWMEAGNQFITDKDAWRKLINEFESLEIGARECFSREVALIENFDMEKFNEIIDSQRIDESFIPFVKYCGEKKIQLVILSEGMDYYIERILSKHGIVVPFYANHCVLTGRDGFRVEFPHSDSECMRCGCCKRNFILNMTGDDEVSVLIGDGFSDICAAEYADIVFAKKSLASYCWKNNITYFDFKSFDDIQKKLDRLSEEGKIRQRQQAKLNRREVFLCG